MANAGPRRGAIIEGINMTPLVDITLVLLIIFIVTARIVVTPAVPLDLPTAASSEELQTILSVVVPAEGLMLVDGSTVDDDGLAAKARSALARDSDLRAVIQADRAATHGRVMTVLDTLKAAGIARVAFGAVRPHAAARPREATRDRVDE